MQAGGPPGTSDTWCLWVLKQDKVTFGRGRGSLVSHGMFGHKEEGNPAIHCKVDGPSGAAGLRGVSQTEKGRCCMVSLTCVILKHSNS